MILDRGEQKTSSGPHFPSSFVLKDSDVVFFCTVLLFIDLSPLVGIHN